MIATDWMERAACAGMDTVFDEDQDKFCVKAALVLCGWCPVTAPCLAYTLVLERRGLRHGVAGGLTPAGREKLVRGASARKRVSQ